MNLNLNKIKSIALYLTKNIPGLTSVKFLKLMYYIDFISVLETGRPVTNDIYYHLPFGPIPSFVKDQVDLLKDGISDFIEKEAVFQQPKSIFDGLIKIDKTGDGQYTYFNLKLVNEDMEIELDTLSQYEIDLIDSIKSVLGGMNAKELVQKTHAEKPYTQTADNNVIDYRLAFTLNREEILPGREYDFDKDLNMATFYGM